MNDDDKWPLVVIAVAVLLPIVVVVGWWWSVRSTVDERPIVGVDGPPAGDAPDPPLLVGVGGEGWPEWPTVGEVRHVALLHRLAEAASSMETVRRPEGDVVVNQPEAPVGDLETLVCSYDWPCQQAVAIAHCESTMRPDVISPTDDYGLMQINGVHRGRWRAMGYSEADMLRPGPNLDVAHSIWAEQGWGPWSCAR